MIRTCPIVLITLLGCACSAFAANDMYYTFGSDATDEQAGRYKSLGVTSVESYVTWQSVEDAGEGKWDWSKWDRQVEILKKNNLKWVPFLIAGPAYADPQWFREGKYHVPCRCLEHNTDNPIESIWNPNLPRYIERFISEFAKRYGSSGIIESVLLGISGDYGEAIFCATPNADWTFDIPGPYHRHPGFWCGDPYALKDYHNELAKRYKTITALNKAWGTRYNSFDEVNFPAHGKVNIKAFRYKLIQSPNAGDRRMWMDFLNWYQGSMTNWADWWIGTTRKYLSESPIYLCTGGDAPPDLGSNFADQCRVAAKHKAGVRITNEASDYAMNFYLTRWVASAGKHFGAYYGFEPAGEENARGVAARIYNATCSGANQLHDYSVNITESLPAEKAQKKNIKYLSRAEPDVPVALWYPGVSLNMVIDREPFIQRVKELRDLFDYDFVDETMLRSGALQKYKALVIAFGSVMETDDAKRIADWTKNGGYVVVLNVTKFDSVEADSETEKILLGSSNCRTIGNGAIERVTNMQALCTKLSKHLSDLRLPVYDMKQDGVYTTDLGTGRFMLLNTAKKDAIAEIKKNGKTISVTVPAESIADVH